MKKLILVLMALVSTVVANAQVGGVTYQIYVPPTNNGVTIPNFNNSNAYQAPKPKSVTQRTTAYYKDSSGNINRIPIVVKITKNYGVTYREIIQIWDNVTSRWDNVTPNRAEPCMPQSNNYLEKQFMFKALVGSSMCYFDL